MGAADLHIHSVHSDGTATVSAILHYASAHTDLDVIAITDHDTLAGALAACEMAVDFRVEVIPGMEITTREGHLLALFLTSPVRPGLSFVETAEAVRLRGGLPFAAHPACTMGNSIGPRRLRQIARRHTGLLAGIEAENGSLPSLRDNARAQDLRWDLGLPGIGNSDAHALSSIGVARTAFPGHTPGHLRQALEVGTVVPLPTHQPNGFFLGLGFHFALRAAAGVVEALEAGDEVRRLRWARVPNL